MHTERCRTVCPAPARVSLNPFRDRYPHSHTQVYIDVVDESGNPVALPNGFTPSFTVLNSSFQNEVSGYRTYRGLVDAVCVFMIAIIIICIVWLYIACYRLLSTTRLFEFASPIAIPI